MTDSHHVALVTGATGAIGTAIAEQLARAPGFEVVLACRSEAKAKSAVRRIQRKTGNAAVRYELVDVSRRPSIADLARRWQGPLHVLVNNAAIAPRKRATTPEGIELQFATNVLGYLWVTSAFSAALERGAPSRVVDVASYWAGGLELDDLEFERRAYDNGSAYRQSKQANRMLSVACAERLRSHGITVNACHPGDVNSALSNDLGFSGHDSPDQGARTPVWLALNEAASAITGKYFEERREVACRFAADRDAVEALYKSCTQPRFSR